MRITPAISLFLTLLISSQALSESTKAQLNVTSGEQRTALIELYTSEGCSSCPPADRWLGNLKDEPGLWTDFIPIALHVDYWDYIGWKDRFARASYSDRQRNFAAAGNARFVYTPGFFRNGQEWRGWTAGHAPRSDKEKVGALSLIIDDDDIEVHFAALDENNASLTAHVAVLGMGLATDVHDGENDGKILRHEFVALNVKTIPMKRTANGYVANSSIPNTTENPPQRAMIAWVSEVGNQAPIQSVGGYLNQN